MTITVAAEEAGGRALAEVRTGALGYSFLIMKRGDRSNIDEIAQAARVARSVGCDYLEVKPAMNAHHEVIPFSYDEVQAIEDQLAEARSLGTDTFRVLHPVTLDHAASGALTDQPMDYNWCPASRFRTVITPSGCYACPYHRGNPDFEYGSIEDASFKELWGGPRFEEMQARLDPSTSCGFHCIRHQQNNYIANTDRRTEVAASIPMRAEVADPFI